MIPSLMVKGRPRMGRRASVSSSWANGEPFTLSGSGFGTASPELLAWDDFETGSNGAEIASAPQAGSMGWTVGNVSDPATYTNTVAHSGSLCYDTGVHNSVANTQFRGIRVGSESVDENALPDVRDFYLSFWFRITPFTGEPQNKVNQWHGYPNGVGDFAPGWMNGSSTSTWWNSYVSLESDQVDYQENWTPGTVPSTDTWYHYEAIGRQSSAPNEADGSVLVKIDGATAYSLSNIITRRNSGARWGLVTIMHGQTRSDSGDYGRYYVDELHLQSDWARVELGDADTYAGCTIRVPQRVSSWADTSIGGTVVKGALSSGTNYAYPIKTDGTVLDPIAVTVG